jgi:hypothetical protein
MNLTPRYTDSHKYPHGYHAACDTNIARTFARIRQQQAAEACGPTDNVAPIKPYLRAA